MAESGGGVNLGSLFYQIEGSFAPLERQLKEFETKIKPIRIRVEIDPSSLQNITKQIQAAVGGSFRAGGGGAGGGVGVGGGGGVAGAGAAPLPAGVGPAPMPPGVVPPPPPPAPPVPPPLPPRPPRPAPPGRRGFFGAPSGMSLYMNALFGGWEVSSAYNAMQSASNEARYQDDLTGQATMMQGVNTAMSGPMGSSIRAIWNLTGASNSPAALEAQLFQNQYIQTSQRATARMAIENRATAAAMPYMGSLAPGARFAQERIDIERERDLALEGLKEQIEGKRQILRRTETYQTGSEYVLPMGAETGSFAPTYGTRLAIRGTERAATEGELRQLQQRAQGVRDVATAGLNRSKLEEEVADTGRRDFISRLSFANDAGRLALQGRTLESDLAKIDEEFGPRFGKGRITGFAGDEKYTGEEKTQFIQQTEQQYSIARSGAFNTDARRGIMAAGGPDAARRAAVFGIDQFTLAGANPAYSRAEAPFLQQGHEALMATDRNINLMAAQTTAYSLAAAGKPQMGALGLMGAQIMEGIRGASEAERGPMAAMGIAQLRAFERQIASGGHAVAGRLSGTEQGGLDSGTEELTGAIKELIAKISEWIEATGGGGAAWGP